MALPTGWPPRAASGVRSLRVYFTGTATTDFTAGAYLFSQVTGANPYTPLPTVAPGSTAQVTIPATPWGGGTSPGSPDPISPGDASIVPMIWCRGMIIKNTGAVPLEISFDGTNVHGSIAAGQSETYNERHEAGIALRGNGGSCTFSVTAW